MIVVVSGCTLARKSSMVNYDRSEWMTTSLCENPIRYPLKESVPDLRYLIIIRYVIVVLWLSTHCVFTGV